jgi:tRNA nucleotidyltransferase (CCA-adding enzyme)
MMATEPEAPVEAPATLHVPPAVRRIVETLEAAGHEAWCVGGAVRDALLGIDNLDWDIATAASPKQVMRLFRRTVPVGIDFGTVGVFVDGDDRLHEVTTFRRDVETDGRHAVVAFGASLDEDLARRDFTINAIAYHPRRAVLHDPYGGRADLERRLVRAVGDPEERLREDRLRALRAIRFAARFGFAIEPATWRAIEGSAPYLGRLSAERVKQELDKTIEQVPRAGGALERWRAAGALASLVPALADLSAEALAALDLAPRAAGPRRDERRLVRMALLFGDVPQASLPATLKALRFSNAELRAVQRLVAGWQALGPAMADALAAAAPPSDADVRRWVARAGRTEMRLVMRVAAARWRARRAAAAVAPAPAAVCALHRRAQRAAYRDPVAVGDLAVGGDDLRAAGIPPGPGMARILQRLLDAVLADPRRNSVAGLLDLARRLAADDPDAGAPGKERTGP